MSYLQNVLSDVEKKYSYQPEFLQAVREVFESLEKVITKNEKLYEDNVEGKISDERFARMSASYEAEQKQLESRKSELESFISGTREQRLNVDSFLGMVRKYTDITELTAEIIRSFVERIEVQKPENYERMQEIAAKLSEPFPVCRVDLYNLDGKIYFGEMTFYHGGCCQEITPEQWDLKLGSWIDLNSPKIVRAN